MSTLLDSLRAFAARFKGEAGYVLTPTESGVRRWRAEPHDLLHTPQHNHPELVPERALRREGHKPNSANDGYRTSLDFVDHFAKFPFGRDRQEGLREASNELGAYTVLGSLGFRVPHTSLIRDDRGSLGVLSRRLGEGGMGIHHTFDPAWTGDYDHFEAVGSRAPHPSDRAYQPLCEALVLDHDRHTGNMMVDEHGRRWDLDFGTSEAHRWLHGLSAHDTGQISAAVDAHLSRARQADDGTYAPALAQVRRLTDPQAESAFEWLRNADPRPFRAVGCENPHRTVTAGFRLLQADLRQTVAAHDGNGDSGTVKSR